MGKKFLTVSTEAFLATIEDHLKDHIKTGKVTEQRRTEELRSAGILVKSGPAAMSIKKKK